MSEFEIYFNDLNEDAQKRLLAFVGAENAWEMNWDMNILPIAIYVGGKVDEQSDEM